MKNKLEYYKGKIAFYIEDSETSLGKIIDLFLLAVNLSACALFIINSYMEKENLLISLSEIVVVSIFIMEYILRFWTSNKKLFYIFSFYGLIDIISILSSMFTFRGLSFLRGLRVLRILRFLRFLETENFFFGKLNILQLQIWRTLFTVFTILFISSGFVLYAEANIPNSSIHNFDEAFYFCVTTLSTVGFGDLVPITVTGRWITVIMILTGTIMVPWQVGKLIKLLISSESNKKDIVCTKCGLAKHDFDASHCKACGSIVFQHYEGDTI